MKKINILLVLASVMLASCAKDTTVDQTADGSIKKTIFATIQNEDDSRVQINENAQTVWTEGDQITVIGPNTYARYKFNGVTGDRAGSFELAENYASRPGAPIDRFATYYALSSTDGFVNYANTTELSNDNEVLATFPSVQNYLENSYGTKANVMAGGSKDGNSYFFQNICAYLRVSLTGSKKVQRLELVGNDNEPISGKTYFNITDVQKPAFRWEGGAVKSVRVECPEEGVQLSDDPVDFYFAIIPTSFTEGFSVLVTFTDGSVFPLSTSKSITLMRNRIRPMSPKSTEGGDWKTAYIYHKGTVAATPQVGGGAYTVGTISWGDNSAVQISDRTNDYVYADGKDKHTISVQVMGATSLTLGHMTGVEKVDLSNF